MEDKEVTFKEEFETMEYEPLSDVEIKLVKWSLGLGVVLLIVFYVLSRFVGH